MAAFPRIARQLNFKRTLTSPITAKLEIPGFSYEAFEHGGDKIQPWSVLHLLYTTYRCFACPETTSDTLQQKSFADLHNFTGKYNFYTIGIDMKLSKYLYSELSPKYPLTIYAALDYVGKSSRRCSYRLYHDNVETEYASCVCTDVLVSQETQRPVPYPEWWIKKFAPLCKNDKLATFALPEDNLQNPCVTSTLVNLSETDVYKHTNASNYIKYCCESVYKNILKNVYMKIGQDQFNSGVKSYNLTVSNQSEVHDKLDIQTWEDSLDDNTVLGQIVKRGGKAICCMKLEFYNDTLQSLL